MGQEGVINESLVNEVFVLSGLLLKPKWNDGITLMRPVPSIDVTIKVKRYRDNSHRFAGLMKRRIADEYLVEFIAPYWQYSFIYRFGNDSEETRYRIEMPNFRGNMSRMTEELILLKLAIPRPS